MKIKKFNLKYSQSEINFVVNNYKKVLQSGFISEGKNVFKFQKKFSQFINCRNCLFVGSGTDALDIAFRMVEKKKIVLQTNNFFAANVAIENANKEAIYCDIELESFGIDYNQLKEIIYNNHKDIGAVCVVHLAGKISKDIFKIKNLCKKYKILLIEDAAHAHGSKIKDYYAGTIGDIGCFSFYPNKIMTTGEGGILVSNNEDLLSLAKSLKNFGRTDSEYIRTNKGINSKVTESQALLGLLELKRVSKRIVKRNKIANMYDSLLKNYDCKFIVNNNYDICSYYKYVVLDRDLNFDKFNNFMSKCGIELPGKSWPYNLHDQPSINKNKNANLNNSLIYAKYHYCLPMYPELEMSEVNYIISKVKYYYDNLK